MTTKLPGLRGETVNVSAGERMISVFAGGLLASAALRQADDRKWAAAALAATGGLLVWRGMSGNCPVSRAVDINTAEPDYRSRHTSQVTTIAAPAAQIYDFWRNFENLPRVLFYLESVQVLDEKHSVWRAKGPADHVVDWVAEIVEDIPGRRIAWRSTGDSLVPNAGSIEFVENTGGRGTLVKVEVDYQPPAGRLGLAAAKIFGRTPGAEIREDLRRLKSMLELGELPTTEGQPSGRT